MLLRFAIPTLGANLLQALQGSINIFWVGQLLGDQALAAMVNAHLFLVFLSALVFGFGTAAMILVGQAVGRRDIHAARQAMGAAIGLFMLLTSATIAAAWILTPQIVQLLGLTNESHYLAIDYLRTVLISTPGAFFMFLLMMGLRAVGDALTPLWFMAMLAILDGVLEPVLIHGIGPVPSFGLMGSALSTTVATYITLTSLILYIYILDLPLRLRGKDFHYLLPNRRYYRAMLVKGLPIGAQMLATSSAALFTIGFINRYGDGLTAAFGAAAQLWMYIQMPALAIAAGMSAMAAQSIGVGRWDRAGAVALTGTVMSLAVTTLLTVAAAVAAPQLLSLFLPADSSAHALGQHIVVIGGSGFILSAGAMALISVIRSSGAVIVPLLITIITLFPIRLGSILLLEPVFGAEAIWWSFPIGFGCAFAMIGAYYFLGRWRSADVQMPSHPQDATAGRSLLQLNQQQQSGP